MEKVPLWHLITLRMKKGGTKRYPAFDSLETEKAWYFEWTPSLGQPALRSLTCHLNHLPDSF